MTQDADLDVARLTPSPPVTGRQARGGLLLYDRAAGTGAFYSVDSSGGMTLLRQCDDWLTSWDLITSFTPTPTWGASQHFAAPDKQLKPLKSAW